MWYNPSFAPDIVKNATGTGKFSQFPVTFFVARNLAVISYFLTFAIISLICPLLKISLFISIPTFAQSFSIKPLKWSNR